MDIVEALPALVEYWHQRCLPLPNAAMTAQLGALLALVAGMRSPAEREETQTVLALQLRKVPADLAVDALDHARDTCTHINQVLPAITEYLEDYPARRRRRRDQVIALAKVAGVIQDERQKS